MGDVDVVIDLDAGEGPGTRRKGIAGRIHAAAGHAETGIGIGGFRVVDAGSLEHVAGAIGDGLVGRIAAINLQIGPAVLDLRQRLEILVGQAHAAIGATTINAKVISRHERQLRRWRGNWRSRDLLRSPKLGGHFGADHNAKAAKTKVVVPRKCRCQAQALHSVAALGRQLRNGLPLTLVWGEGVGNQTGPWLGPTEDAS